MSRSIFPATTIVAIAWSIASIIAAAFTTSVYSANAIHALAAISAAIGVVACVGIAATRLDILMAAITVNHVVVVGMLAAIIPHWR